MGRSLDTMYLGIGEYDQPGSWFSQYTAYFRFLEEVRRWYPQVLDDLAAYPHTESTLRTDPTSVDVPWMRNWATTHHLTPFSLISMIAINTVQNWLKDADARDKREWCFPQFTAFEVPPTSVQLPEPNPLTESKDAWMNRAAVAWRERCQELKAAGYVRSAVKSQPKHFEWLANVVVGREKYETVGRRANASRQTVTDGVKPLAKWLGIEIPNRGGERKRK